VVAGSRPAGAKPPTARWSRAKTTSASPAPSATAAHGRGGPVSMGSAAAILRSTGRSTAISGISSAVSSSTHGIRSSHHATDPTGGCGSTPVG
jgi:hypothetical protein